MEGKAGAGGEALLCREGLGYADTWGEKQQRDKQWRRQAVGGKGQAT